MRREEESTAADNWEEREGGGTGRRTSFQEHVRVGRCPPMVDPHAGGSAQRASEGRALLLRLIDHTAVPGRRLGASAGVALPRPETIDLRFMSAKVKKSPCEHRFARFRMPLAAWLE